MTLDALAVGASVLAALAFLVWFARRSVRARGCSDCVMARRRIPARKA